jgi:hypothetical protein
LLLLLQFFHRRLVCWKKSTLYVLPHQSDSRVGDTLSDQDKGGAEAVLSGKESLKQDA